MFDIEVCVFEKATKHMVVIDREVGWYYALEIITKEDADLYGINFISDPCLLNIITRNTTVIPWPIIHFDTF